KNKLFEKVEVAGPGFINFYLSKEVFINELKKIDKNFGRNNNFKNKKIIIEYTDPNILKEFHIGHLMSNVIGESISRVLEFEGSKIKRLCYQSDVGISIAKAIYGKLKNPNYNWQESYVFGNKQYEEGEISKREIVELNKKIFEKSDKSVNKLYDEGKKWSIDYFNLIYKKLGTKFNEIIFESQVAGFGKKIVEKNIGSVFDEGDKGAIVFKGENKGLHTRVFINSEGLPTYEAKELGLANFKYKKYKYDKSIVVTGKEVNDYFKVVMSAMSQIFPDLRDKTHHIGHGMMRLPEGKMSSRTGNVIGADSLIEKVKEEIQKKVGQRNLEDSELEKISIGAIKYSILKQSIGSDIIYDFEKSISFEGDSGPYLQYSHVRANSVLEKSKKERVKSSFKNTPLQVRKLEKIMVRFPEVVEEAGEKYEPHIIATYLIELAREFNSYYSKNKIVDNNDEFSPYKVALTRAFSIIIKNGLWLLGIPAPERM
ncbi:MAG: arginine--tRNA ligase, partial [Candidatus Staskawiczbacteria bacterium]|nr:arginine--tRNA ligase [Candidatus Staskawiczbacteria bacterium]